MSRGAPTCAMAGEKNNVVVGCGLAAPRLTGPVMGSTQGGCPKTSFDPQGWLAMNLVSGELEFQDPTILQMCFKRQNPRQKMVGLHSPRGDCQDVHKPHHFRTTMAMPCKKASLCLWVWPTNFLPSFQKTAAGPWKAQKTQSKHSKPRNFRQQVLFHSREGAILIGKRFFWGLPG